MRGRGVRLGEPLTGTAGLTTIRCVTTQSAAERAADGRASGLISGVLNPSVMVMRRIALAGVIVSSAIVWTGGAVRLSQSGLGCTTWPKCTPTSLAAGGATGDPLIHRWVEFGNRLLVVAVFVVAVLVFAAAWRFRDGRTGTRRRDLVWLASAQPGGIVAQSVIGGILVRTHLNPYWESVHYLATIPVIAAAVALYVRCSEPTGPVRSLVPRMVRAVSWALVAVVCLMMAIGTLVSGTGPLAGAASVPRYHFISLTGITQLHADVGWALGVLTIGLLLMLILVQAPARPIRLCWTVLGLIGLQGVIGYIQYFLHLPAGLVWVHVANTALIWVAVMLLAFSLRARDEAADPGPGALAEPLSDPVAGPIGG